MSELPRLSDGGGSRSDSDDCCQQLARGVWTGRRGSCRWSSSGSWVDVDRPILDDETTTAAGESDGPKPADPSEPGRSIHAERILKKATE